jgi:hypothetical protein
MAAITLRTEIEVEYENPIVEMATVLAVEHAKGALNRNWTDPQKDGWKDIFSELPSVVAGVMSAASNVINGLQTKAEMLDQLQTDQYFNGMCISDSCVRELIQIGIDRFHSGLIK